MPVEAQTAAMAMHTRAFMLAKNWKYPQLSDRLQCKCTNVDGLLTVHRRSPSALPAALPTGGH